MRQRMDRVGDATTMHAGMFVAIRAGHRQFAPDKTFQPLHKAWLVSPPLPAIRGKDHIRLQQVRILLDKGWQGRRADFFLPFIKDLHIDRQGAMHLQHRLKREDGRQHIALVIGRAAAIDPAILDDGFKRRAVPQIERVGRLNIKMPIDQNGRLVRASLHPIAIHNGMGFGFHHPGIGNAGIMQPVNDPVTSPHHIVKMRILSRDGRYRNEIRQGINKAVLMAVEIGVPVHIPVPVSCRAAAVVMVRRDNSPNLPTNVIALQR